MRSEIIHLTTSKEVKEEAKRMAEEEGRTLSMFADLAVRELIKRRKQEEKKAVSDG